MNFFNSEHTNKEKERLIIANNLEYNASFKYANNKVVTAKYSVLSFLPKNLFEQFQQTANAYFLCLMVLQLIPQISSLTWVTIAIPLFIVLIMKALKDLSDDVKCHQSDNQINNRLCDVVRNGSLKQIVWSDVVVGDILYVKRDQFIPADLILLSTSEPNSSSCFIETLEVDGESNLKSRQALSETSLLKDELVELSKFEGVVSCESPNTNLIRFEGVLRWKRHVLSISNQQVVLRGCVLRNTKWCFGLVVFAGQDTKIVKNRGRNNFKRTNIDHILNLLIMGIFVFLFALCSLCAICCGIWEALFGYEFQAYLPWEHFVPGSWLHTSKPKNFEIGAFSTAALVFLSYIMLLNTLVPISLYIGMELIRLVHSWWINWDCQMYHNGRSVKSRSTVLNEELGQVQYIFSDKTGTLTQEISKNHDEKLLTILAANDVYAFEFMRLLAICHTIQAEERNGKLIYKSQSPDEKALSEAARKYGFVFLDRQTVLQENQENGGSQDFLTIKVMDHIEVYEVLCVFDFDCDRKRMSILVKRDNKLTLYCKGADCAVFERLDHSQVDVEESTVNHVKEFAKSGLRTLCCAKREIDPDYFEDWMRRCEEIRLLPSNREMLMSELYEEMESDMILLGATAVEDKLQAGVPEAISSLRSAGIKIWMITGDKEETAMNIAFSCKLLDEDIFYINGDTEGEVRFQLEKAKKEIHDFIRSGMMDMTGVDLVSCSSLVQSKVSYPKSFSESNSTGFALIIRGCSLVHAMNCNLAPLFLEISCLCRSVICSRATPLQKASIVEYIKRFKKSITLAIGDGGNDVNMIKSAHIGVGISGGHEGMQAAFASDFSIAQFGHLRRLLLVHGRWSYIRVSKFLHYFFYKNFAFTVCHLWYAFFCGFSAQCLFDPFFISMYNIFFTSLPVMMLAMFEQDVSDELSLKYPKLYTPGIRNTHFNKRQFVMCIVEGVLTSFLLFFIPYGTFENVIQPDGRDLADHKTFGTVVANILVVVVSLRCGLETMYWTSFSHFVIWGSMIFYFGLTFILYWDSFEYIYVGVAVTIDSNPNFWFTLPLTVVALTVPIMLMKFYASLVHPSLVDKLRRKQISLENANLNTSVELAEYFREVSSMYGSPRSGYVSTTDKGFGKSVSCTSKIGFNACADHDTVTQM